MTAAEPAAPARRARRDDLAFLPAALEVLETPPSPTARILAGAVMAFFALAIAWSWFGHVDIVAVGDGRIIPTDRIKVVQAAETGVVHAIHVREGQFVKAGQPLIELDATISGADRDRLTGDLATARAVAARHRAFLKASTADEARRLFAPPAGTPAEITASQLQLLLAQIGERQAKLKALDDEIARREAERRTIQSNIQRAELALPKLRERVAARDELAERGYGSRLVALEVQQQLIEHEGELAVLRSRLAESAATIAAGRSERRRVEAEFVRAASTELAEAETRGAALAQELIKATQRNDMQVLAAPIDGQVQQLAANTVGGVVTPAQALMAVVPLDALLEVEAMMPNKDIGFIEAGQEVAVKLETFPFTRYGTLPGKVAHISRDAVADERQGLVYLARVALDRSTINADGREVPLASGMRATVEIKTGDRRLIQYLLSPVLKATTESMRER
jgi:hemolysin D